MENKQTYCPLDAGNIDIEGSSINVHGDRVSPDTDKICAIGMLKRQIGIKAGFAKCDSCKVDVQVGKFSSVSSGSLTD